MTQQRIVITGAGSGLGRSLAKKLLIQGHHAFLLGRSNEKLTRVREEVPGRADVYALDISNKAEVMNVFQNIETEHGPIHMLINNAGTGAFHLVEDLSETQIDAMMDVNLKGTIYCTQQVIPSMKQENHGLIINIVSTAGKVGKVTESVYCANINVEEIVIKNKKNI